MKAYAYNVEGAGLMCPDCAWRYTGIAALSIEVEEAEGYPDGYTCADCGTVTKERM